LSEEVFVHFELIAIFIVVGGLVADLLLAKVTLHAALKRSFFVVERFKHRGQPVFPLKVILIDKSHKLLQSVLCLEPGLFSLSVFLRLVLVDLLLIFVTIAVLIKFDLNSDEVTFHAVDHMLI